MTQQSNTYICQPPDLEPPVLGLYEIIKGIAKKIALPEDWDRKLERCAAAAFSDGGVGTDSSRLLELQAGLLAGSLKSSFRLWRAAAALHFSLKEVTSHGPRWRNWMATGMPAVLDSDEQKQAMLFLERITQDHEGRLQAYLHGKVDISLSRTRNIPPLFSNADARWVECLGFERTEVIELLDGAGIPHDLASQTKDIEALRPISAACTDSESTQPSASDGENQNTSTETTDAVQDCAPSSAFAMMVSSFSGDQKVSPVQANNPASGKVTLLDVGKSKHDALDDQIDHAIELANGSYRTSSVWQHLKKLAESRQGPFTGFLSEKGGLNYEKDNYKVGEDPVGTFSKNALDLRLQRRWEKLGHVSRRR